MAKRDDVNIRSEGMTALAWPLRMPSSAIRVALMSCAKAAGVAPERSGELVEREEEGEAAARSLGPVVKFSSCGGQGEVGEPGADLVIHPALHPVVDPLRKMLLVGPDARARKPKSEDLFRVVGRGGHRGALCERAKDGAEG